MPLSITTAAINVHAPQTSSSNVDISQAYAQGDHDYAVSMDTTPWPISASITLLAEFSPDGGTTWGWGASATTTGGPHTTPSGAAAWPVIGGSLPNATDPSFTNAGWPTVQPAQVLARVTVQVPSNQRAAFSVSTT